MTKLSPCPLCETVPITCLEGPHVWSVLCRKCQIHIYAPSAALATDLWEDWVEGARGRDLYREMSHD